MGKYTSKRISLTVKVLKSLVKQRTGTEITFLPDSEIFAITEFSYDILSNRLRELAFLNKGVSIKLSDERSDKHQEFCYEGGIASFVEHLSKNKQTISGLYFESDDDGPIQVELACQWNDSYGKYVRLHEQHSTPMAERIYQVYALH